MSDDDEKTPYRPDWLNGREERDYFVYSIDELRATDGLDVRELPGGWLILQRAKDHGGLWLRFAVLDFFQSEMNGQNELATCLFFGDGPGGKAGESLRECRHTYWGEDGYIFYPDGPLIAAAFEALSEFYDDLVKR